MSGISSNRTYNKFIGYYTSLISWYNDEFDQTVKNVFEKVNRLPIISNPQAIKQEEFELLIKQINPENGIIETSNSGKNMYRPWLADCFRLALATGRRREEVTNLKFNQVVINDSGNGYIKCPDIKVNRIQNRTKESELKYIYIPLSQTLKKLLMKLNYEDFKNTDEFIIAPDLKVKRNKIMSDTLSRGFSHFYNQLNTDRKLTFKSLRKAYISSLQAQMGNAKAITGHSSDNVVEQHYLDKEFIALSLNNFEVFNDKSRNDEITKSRDRSQSKSKKGIER